MIWSLATISIKGALVRQIRVARSCFDQGVQSTHEYLQEPKDLRPSHRGKQRWGRHTTTRAARLVVARTEAFDGCHGIAACPRLGCPLRPNQECPMCSVEACR